MTTQNLTYKSSGVDKEAGYESVKMMKQHVRKTFNKNVLTDIGSFSGLFAIDKNEFEEPVLVSGTDGVGTKIMLAFMTGKHNTVGEDCVAMCVNDILCQGARALFFLDYIATGKLKPEKIAAIVEGVANGCVKCGAALIGGETAEMPGLYSEEEFDLAGFAVGIVDKKKIINGSKITAGDALIGLPSSGLHSNGFSLVRKVFFDVNNYTVDTFVPEFNSTLGDELLKPTRIYHFPVYELTQTFNIKGISHITGGGFYENIPRMFPEGYSAKIDFKSLPQLPVYELIRKLGNIELREMYGTFNMGIGLVMAVAQTDADNVLNFLRTKGENPIVMGEVVSGDNEVIIEF